MDDANERMRMQLDRARKLRDDHAECLREDLVGLREEAAEAQATVAAAEEDLAHWLKSSLQEVLQTEADHNRREAERVERAAREREKREELRKDNQAMNDARVVAVVKGRLTTGGGSTGEFSLIAWLGLSFSAILTGC